MTLDKWTLSIGFYRIAYFIVHATLRQDQSAPQGVVEGNGTAGSEQPEAALVVVVVARFVGVDEREVEAVLLSVSNLENKW